MVEMGEYGGDGRIWEEGEMVKMVEMVGMVEMGEYGGIWENMVESVGGMVWKRKEEGGEEEEEERGGWGEGDDEEEWGGYFGDRRLVWMDGRTGSYILQMFPHDSIILPLGQCSDIHMRFTTPINLIDLCNCNLAISRHPISIIPCMWIVRRFCDKR
jgi:hypothetical protein